MRRKQSHVLVIDGYNVINAWNELKVVAESNLEEARRRLNETIAEYGSYRGITCYIIYDAYNVKTSMDRKETIKELTIIYTKEKQTADSYIEKFIAEFEDKRNTLIQVATDDLTEQNMILGKGASRMATRELYVQVSESKKKIKEKISKKTVSKNTLDTILDKDTLAILEKIRRSE